MSKKKRKNSNYNYMEEKINHDRMERERKERETKSKGKAIFTVFGIVGLLAACILSLIEISSNGQTVLWMYSMPCTTIGLIFLYFSNKDLHTKFANLALVIAIITGLIYIVQTYNIITNR